jgi:hypothetical protein
LGYFNSRLPNIHRESKSLAVADVANKFLTKSGNENLVNPLDLNERAIEVLVYIAEKALAAA